MQRARTGNATRHVVRQEAATDVAIAPPPAPHSRPKRRKGFLTHLKRVWIPILIVFVVAIAGFCVHRLRDVFGSNNEVTRPGSGLANDTKPFNPKQVKYEIFGPAGAVATINYLDLDAQPQEVKDVPLPWSITLTTTAPAASANIVAQGDSSTIGCRITVNGEVKDENSSEGVNAQTFCLVKSA